MFGRSGCFDASAFSEAVENARRAFDVAATVGFQFTLLDVGGGFPGNDRAAVSFKDIANVLNAALDAHFPASSGVRVIAEPGRYYVSSCATLLANVTSKRRIKNAAPDEHEVSLVAFDLLLEIRDLEIFVELICACSSFTT
jgi:ornithine decarboxylase